MKERWNQFTLREKQSILTGIIILIVFLLYEITLSPLISHNNNLRASLSHEKQLLTWMQTADHEIQHLNQLSHNNKHAMNPAAMLGIIQHELNQSSFREHLVQLTQAENNSVQITLAKVNFDTLMGWLIQLEQKYHFSVNQMTASPNGPLGVVDTTFHLIQ